MRLTLSTKLEISRSAFAILKMSACPSIRLELMITSDLIFLQSLLIWGATFPPASTSSLGGPLLFSGIAAAWTLPATSAFLLGCSTLFYSVDWGSSWLTPSRVLVGHYLCRLGHYFTQRLHSTLILSLAVRQPDDFYGPYNLMKILASLMNSHSYITFLPSAKKAGPVW